MSKVFTILYKEDGAIKNRRKVEELFNELKDGKWLLEINQHNKRSDPQNKYYWSVVVPLIQERIKDFGHQPTKEETHDFLKGKFNSEEIVNEETGEFINIPRSTTILSKEKFSEYIQKIQIWAAEFLSINIPDPGQQLTMEV